MREVPLRTGDLTIRADGLPVHHIIREGAALHLDREDLAGDGQVGLDGREIGRAHV